MLLGITMLQILNEIRLGSKLRSCFLVMGLLRAAVPANNLLLLGCWPGLLFLILLVFAVEKYAKRRVRKPA